MPLPPPSHLPFQHNYFYPPSKNTFNALSLAPGVEFAFQFVQQDKRIVLMFLGNKHDEDNFAEK